MRPHGLEQLLILDIPNILIGPSRHIGDELTETPVGIALGQRGDRRKQVHSLRIVHGNTSFTFGIRVTSSRGRSWIISAGTSSPGLNFAARVARVTPSFIRRCPSLPPYQVQRWHSHKRVAVLRDLPS